VAVRFFRWFKTIPYQNTTEEVGNIYMYDNFSEGGAGTDPPLEIRTVEGDILDAEKSIHSSRVVFRRVESGLVRPPKANEKYPVPGLVDYTRELVPGQPGARSAGATFRQPEDCMLVQRRISNRGWLRKYWHICDGLKSGGTQGYNWTWDSGLQADALVVIQGLDELNGAAPTLNVHRLSNSRGQRPGQTGGLSGPWQVQGRVVYHELKY
jgi:hypothetical protein